jgi:sulfide:quinone oxidoreductase
MAHYQVLIVGGGSAGLTVAAMLCNKPNPPQVAIVEPGEKHYYQPLWTLVGGGEMKKEVTERNESDYSPPGATWLKNAVSVFEPEANRIRLAGGESHTYDVLIVSAGIQLDWNKIPGLEESVGKTGSGVCSNYSYKTVESTFENIKNLKKGVALFTEPAHPVKCHAAAIKIAYLASNYWQKNGLSGAISVKFFKSGDSIFEVKKYAEALEKAADRYGFERTYGHELIALRPEKKEAVFQHRHSGKERIEKYDMIHVVPPQSAPDFIKNSPLSDAAGWVAVDPLTTQHIQYPNVFSLGDCSSLPTLKSGAGIRKQAPVTVANVMAFLAGAPLPAKYNGYTSCPLVTGYGKMVLAEFDYDLEPLESFPFDQGQERYSMYALKMYLLPQMYWHGMLRGREF